MKTITKILSLGLCFLLLIGLLVACNNDENTPNNSQEFESREQNENNRGDSHDTISYSEGLDFSDNGDGTASVSGIGKCSDTIIYIPPTTPEGAPVTNIASDAFRGCVNLISVTIPDSVTSIDNSAFEHCNSLTSIIIPDSVTSIGGSAFFDTVYYNDSKNWKNGVLYIGNHLIEAKNTISGSYTIKEKTTTIASYAFSDCSNLTRLAMPDSVTSIGEYAFYDCSSLTNITIPNSVTSIGGMAFAYCSNLTSIVIPNGVTNIDFYTFHYCDSLTSITISDSVTSINNHAFENCDSLTSITIPNSVTSISASAFADCDNLTNITVDKGNKKYHSTDNCLIESKSNTLILGCQNSVIPADGSVTSIGNWAFNNCRTLTSIMIPNSVTKIGTYAFAWCYSLTSVTISSSVTNIDDSAFCNCNSLTDIYFTGTKAEWSAIEKSDAMIPQNVTIHFNYVSTES